MKPQYRVRNWPKYTAGLEQRGSLTFWISPDVLANWTVKEKSGKRGASATYSNQAIVTMVSLKSLFKLPSRALCGFIESIFQLMQVALAITTTYTQRGSIPLRKEKSFYPVGKSSSNTSRL